MSSTFASFPSSSSSSPEAAMAVGGAATAVGGAAAPVGGSDGGRHAGAEQLGPAAPFLFPILLANSSMPLWMARVSSPLGDGTLGFVRTGRLWLSRPAAHRTSWDPAVAVAGDGVALPRPGGGRRRGFPRHCLLPTVNFITRTLKMSSEGYFGLLFYSKAQDWIVNDTCHDYKVKAIEVLLTIQFYNVRILELFLLYRC